MDQTTFGTHPWITPVLEITVMDKVDSGNYLRNMKKTPFGTHPWMRSVLEITVVDNVNSGNYLSRIR